MPGSRCFSSGWFLALKGAIWDHRRGAKSPDSSFIDFLQGNRGAIRSFSIGEAQLEQTSRPRPPPDEERFARRASGRATS